MNNVFVRVLTLLVVLIFGYSCSKPITTTVSAIIPQPVSVVTGEGFFALSNTTKVNLWSVDWAVVSDWLDGLPIDQAYRSDSVSGNVLNLALVDSADFSSLQAYTLEITPLSITIKASNEAGLFYGVQSLRQLYHEYGVQLPTISITDSPRFAHRGFLLDVSSHMFSVEFIKKQLDMMAHYKINTLYWALVGKGGWRMQIEGSEWLTQRGAWRTVEDYLDWENSGAEFCTESTPNAYGGFYTAEQIAQVICYAKSLYIDVVPVLDIALEEQSMPEAFRNTGKLTKDGSGIDLMERVIAKITAMFPSPWMVISDLNIDRKQGPKCKMCGSKQDEQREATAIELAMGRLEKLLSDHNRKLLSPEIFASLDCYQSDAIQEPEAMTGFVPIERVYLFNPSAPQSVDTVDHFDGVCVALWSHFTDDDASAEYMIYPRILALSEVGWSLPERKSYRDFEKRASKAVVFLRENGYNTFDLDKQVTVRPEYIKTVENLALQKTVHYHIMYDDQYPAAGLSALVDGERGGWSYDDLRWQGFQGSGMNLSIDMGASTVIKSISSTFMQDRVGRIWLPREVEISTSNDGKRFTNLTKIANKAQPDVKGLLLEDYVWEGEVTARYIHYIVKTQKNTKSWIFTDEIVIR